MIIKINKSIDTTINNQPFELVELKGSGHPDSVCDSIAEEIAIDLNKAYIETYGEPQHFNVDKSLLIAGESITKFGGGELIKAPTLFIGDRATKLPDNKEISIAKLIAENYYKREFNTSLDVNVHFSHTASQLNSVFKHRLSNDTSACVGYAPYSKLENIILKTQKLLESFPEDGIGKDTKIMGVRKGANISLTIAIAFIDKFIIDIEQYNTLRYRIIDYLIERLHISDIKINPDGVYTTVTGTSIECGDSGQVGRGNRYNGVISLCRNMSTEAYHGKNNLTHIGKIYNKISFDLATEIYEMGATDAIVWLKNDIGADIKNPEVFVKYESEINMDLIIEEKIKEFIKNRIC